MPCPSNPTGKEFQPHLVGGPLVSSHLGFIVIPILGLRIVHFLSLYGCPCPIVVSSLQECMPNFVVSISGNMDLPDALELIYQSALALGKHAAVSIVVNFILNLLL